MTDKYFVMGNLPSPDSVEGYMEIEDWNDILGFGDWRTGALARQRPTEAIRIDAVPHEGYAGDPDDFNDNSAPLMSARLKLAIESADVDNIHFVPVTLRNTKSEHVYAYFAFNLLGLISAADLAKSKIISHDGRFVGDSEIHDLEIDEARCRALLMFRLKEKFSVVLVHKRVKDAIEGAGIDTVKFVAPEDFMLL